MPNKIPKPIQIAYANLCTRDPRNEYYEMLYADEPAEEIPPVRTECSCDYCFYSRDKLAMIIIALYNETHPDEPDY